MKKLQLLKGNRVFEIEKQGSNFEITELCDENFSITLTPEELLELSEEIKDLVETSK
jgi:hypothetical protein